MCKSFDVSLLTGIYSYAIAFYLYKRNIQYDRLVAILLFSFSTIQWLEAFLWYDLGNLGWNRFFTALIPIVLASEFLSSLYGASLYSKISGLEKLIYGFSALILIMSWYLRGSGITTVDPTTGSLLWSNIPIEPINRFAFLALLLYPFIRFLGTSTSITMIVIVTIALFFYSFRFGDTFGSNWCWIANITSLIQLLSPYIKA